MHQRISYQFKNNVLQWVSARILGISLSKAHNIIKKFGESREISVLKSQGWKLLQNAHDIWSFRWHCIKNNKCMFLWNVLPHGLWDALRNCRPWTQGTQMLVKTVLCTKEAMCQQCPETQSLGSSSSKMDWCTVETYIVVYVYVRLFM